MKFIIFLPFVFFLSPMSWASSVFFKCNTDKGLLTLKTDANRLIYEMKKSDGSAFSYSSLAPAYSGFLYSHYSRFQTDYLNVSFNQSGFKYTVFSNYEDGGSSRGVTVTNLKNNKDFTYDCQDDGVDKLSDLTDLLQCDKDSALGGYSLK